MHKYLKHRYKLVNLPNHVQDEITKMNYNEENVEKMINLCKLDININSFFIIALKIENDLVYKYCRTNLYKIAPSKTRRDKKEYICKNCYYTAGKHNCECKIPLSSFAFWFICLTAMINLLY
ncbi:MAG: hypothetical protein COA39_009410 [Sulfurimonas sp.]|nr:hypothetical protein [Sulfurimonas sp.]